MNMTNGFFRTILVGMFASVCVSLGAQTGSAYGAYSPYSVYGIGDIAKEGTAFNRSMGGVGIATRNRRFINTLNPASLSAIDSSSFMADFGLKQNNKIFQQKVNGSKIKSADNTFNINNFVMAFPVYKSSAMMVGIVPFSDIGYDFSSYETDQDIIGNSSTINYTHYGEGSVYQIFLGGGVQFWKRLSVGAQLNYYFGSIDKVAYVDFTDASYQCITSGVDMRVRGAGGKLGVQYDHPFSKNMHFVLGATYRFRSRMRGSTDVYQFGDQSSVRDTISYNTLANKDGLRIADEFGIGIALRKGEKWAIEVDYVRSGWQYTGMDNSDYTGTVNEGFEAKTTNSVRAGFEYVPNRNDIRYYMKRCSYRVGAYYDESYYTYYGDIIASKGITFGITLPVYRLYNGLTLGFDLGQKGNLKNNKVREFYGTINIGFNIHDLWFQKQKYE